MTQTIRAKLTLSGEIDIKQCFGGIPKHVLQVASRCTRVNSAQQDLLLGVDIGEPGSQ